jgi:hypothetical protein
MFSFRKSTIRETITILIYSIYVKVIDEGDFPVKLGKEKKRYFFIHLSLKQ